MRRVIVGRIMVVATCVLAPLFGASMAHGEPGPLAVTTVETTAEMPSAQGSFHDDLASWGLLGLLGLVGLVGLVGLRRPRRRRRVVSDPFAAYAVMRDRQPSSRTPSPAASARRDDTFATPSATARNRPHPPAPTAYLPSAVPTQHRGADERPLRTSQPASPPPAPVSEPRMSSERTTKGTANDGVRFMFVPPSRSERSREPGFNSADASGAVGGEPRWPQREYF